MKGVCSVRETEVSRDNGAGHDPRFSLGVKLCAHEEEQRCESVQPMIEGILDQAAGIPQGERRAKIVQREQAPACGPKQQIGLTLQVVDVREETSHQGGSCE